MRIRCWTTFDITVTGVRNNFNVNRLPFQDQQGRCIDTAELWHHARNQQRNWDTVNQLLSLRALPSDITDSQRADRDIRIWQFEFTVDHVDAFSDGGRIFGALEHDCRGVPMITGLEETAGQISLLEPGANIKFSMVPGK
jgi:hypothetical protein